MVVRMDLNVINVMDGKNQNTTLKTIKLNNAKIYKIVQREETVQTTIMLEKGGW